MSACRRRSLVLSLNPIRQPGIWQKVDKENSQCDAEDKMLAQDSLPPLPPDTYTVIWQATSDGGQVTAVQFKFAITASGLADTR